MTLGGESSWWLRGKLAYHFYRSIGYTPTASVWIALYSTYANLTTDTEFSASAGYNRVQLTGGWNSTTTSDYSNTNTITFPTATSEWGNVNYVAIKNAATSGSILYWTYITGAPIVVNDDYTFVIPAGGIHVVIERYTSGAYGDDGYWSSYYADKILDGTLNGVSLGTPTDVWVRLFNGRPSSMGIEIDASDYSPINYVGSQWSASGVSGSIGNTDTLTFTSSATEDWGLIDWIGMFDASTSGHLIYEAKLLPVNTVVETGDGFRISASAIRIQADYSVNETVW
jgi:hypothetical protein